jgi:hypothetical protein
MADWQKLVRRRLNGLELDAFEREEVCAELAAHLEENFEGLRRRGLAEDEARSQTLSQVRDWSGLVRKIQNAKSKENFMNDRVRQFWFPALLTLFLYMASLMLIQLFGPDPVMIAKRNAWTYIAPVVVVYLPWILSLPFIGAIGAYLSSRAGGSQRTMFFSVLSPALPYAVFFAIGMPMILILNDRIRHNILFSALLAGLIAWVIAPSLALLAGALLAKLFLSRRQTYGAIASP